MRVCQPFNKLTREKERDAMTLYDEFLSQFEQLCLEAYFDVKNFSSETTAFVLAVKKSKDYAGLPEQFKAIIRRCVYIYIS